MKRKFLKEPKIDPISRKLLQKKYLKNTKLSIIIAES